MALIKCPECNANISDKADSCPSCGFPILKNKALNSEKTKVLNQIKKEEKYSDNILKIIKDSSKDIRSDKEVIIEAIKKNGFAICYMELYGEKLKDKELVLAAAKNIHQLGDDIGWSDYDYWDFMEKMQELSPTLLKNKKFALSLLKEVGGALEYFSEEIKDDKEIVLAAVTEDGGVYPDASPRLKKDKDVGLAAVESLYTIYEDLDEKLKNDKDIVLAVIEQSSTYISKVPEKFRDDKDVMMIAVSKWGENLRFASPRLQDNKLIVKEALFRNGDNLQYASTRLQNDKKIVIEAIENGLTKTYLIGDSLLEDEEVISLAKENGHIFDPSKRKKYFIGYDETNNFTKKHKALDGYNNQAYVQLMFRYSSMLENGEFCGNVVSKNDRFVSYKFKLPTNEKFKAAYGPIVVYYTVDLIKGLVTFTNITPEEILSDVSLDDIPDDDFLTMVKKKITNLMDDILDKLKK